MKANIFRKTLSLLLALALLAGCTSAWATTEVIVNATDTDQKDVEIEEIEIKETTPEYEDTNGLFVTADNGHEADVEVEEGVSAEEGLLPEKKPSELKESGCKPAMAPRLTWKSGKAGLRRRTPTVRPASRWT